MISEQGSTLVYAVTEGSGDWEVETTYAAPDSGLSK
jgi:hypothetical protein